MSESLNRITLLCRVALAIGGARPNVLNEALQECHTSERVSPREVEECILQGIPYAGFPGAGEAFALWRQLEPEACPPPESNELSVSAAQSSADDNFNSVYGHVAEEVRGQLRNHHAQLEKWILGFAYGEVMGRGILPLRDLEALGVASLLGQGRRAQLHSHLRGALRCGWEPAELHMLLERLEPWCDAAIHEFACGIVAAKQ